VSASTRLLCPLSVLVPLILVGCDEGPKYPPPCPALTLLPDAGDVTTYVGAGRDLTDLQLQARIAGVPARCVRGDPGTVVATLQVQFGLTRGPANPSRAAELGYFVAVKDGGRIVDERDFTLRAVFPANIDDVKAGGEEVTLNLPVTAARTAAAYTIFVGFRLTPEQLRANRAAKR